MTAFNPFHYTFHCECKVLDLNDRETNVMYNINTKISLGELYFLNKKLLLRKYNKILDDRIKDDINIKSYTIIKSEFVLDLR